MTKWSEVTRNGVIDKTRWIKLRPLSTERMAMARRIYAEHGAQAKGEPYGASDDARAANGTVAEAQFADHFGLPWSGGVTVADPRSVVADVGLDIQVYTSGAIDGRLIVHADELEADQRWVHLTGVAPDDLWFVGWASVGDLRAMWPVMPDDPRRTGGKVFGQFTLRPPSTFVYACGTPVEFRRCRTDDGQTYCFCHPRRRWCGVCEGNNPKCISCDGTSTPV